jgi:hypothetical protein
MNRNTTETTSRRASAILVLLLAASAAACHAPEWKQKLTYARFPVAVYVEHRERDDALVPQGFAHPVQVSPEEMTVFLGSLRYTAWGLFKGSRVEALFEENELPEVAGPLAAALKKVGPDERVRFLVSRKSRSALNMGPTGVSGVLFAPSPDRLDLAFDLLDEGLPDDTSPRTISFRQDPVEITGRKEELIVPAWASIVKAEGNDFHPRWVEVERRVLATAKLERPEPPAPAAASGTPPSAPAPAQGTQPAPGGAQPAVATAPSPPAPPASPALPDAEVLKRKLQNLDELKRQGVISQEEYDARRKDILLQKD